MMHGRGKSDGSVVPSKPPNNAAQVAAEVVEGRDPAKGNRVQQNALRTQSRGGAPSALDRVRQAAVRDKKARFTALMHHITPELLRSSFLMLKRKAAVGVDGVTWDQYRVNLDGNIQDLHGRLRRGAYRAKPSRRVFIPKADGKQRPIGIAALEDKIVQRAVVEVLNAIYEVDFLGFSYGFRPGRSQHMALDALAVGILRKKVNWVLDADIRGFFDAIDHGWMMRFLKHRIADRRLLGLIQKWLSAGVLHGGVETVGSVGSPQGAVISPLLANIYLHYVFDLWVHRWRQRHARGEVIVVRYADDIVLGFQHQGDALQFQSELQGRMARFGLELHPDKTRLIEFGRFAAVRRQESGQGKAETFDFLGFKHICGKTRVGRFLLRRHTLKERMRATLKAIRARLMRVRHLPIPTVGAWLHRVIEGYFGYHAVPTNVKLLCRFRSEVSRAWLHALRHRSQRHRMTWARMKSLIARWIPPARILHPWPERRFDANTRGRSPVR